jgi:hypothetical protein
VASLIHSPYQLVRAQHPEVGMCRRIVEPKNLLVARIVAIRQSSEPMMLSQELSVKRPKPESAETSSVLSNRERATPLATGASVRR